LRRARVILEAVHLAMIAQQRRRQVPERRMPPPFRSGTSGLDADPMETCRLSRRSREKALCTLLRPAIVLLGRAHLGPQVDRGRAAPRSFRAPAELSPVEKRSSHQIMVRDLRRALPIGTGHAARGVETAGCAAMRRQSPRRRANRRGSLR
jgi:hypothetical protein